MKLGIVGSEAAKFTQDTERAARMALRSMIKQCGANLVISGHSPLGGIDWWAIEEANALGVPTREYEPRVMAWAAPGGFRTRNLKIALDSDIVACITLKELPPGYTGMRFPEGCYHCKTPPEDHVKSGGCWTLKQARRQGKINLLVVIDPTGSLKGRGFSLDRAAVRT
jgi:hypothetical protein